MKKNLLVLFLMVTFVFPSALVAQTVTKPNSPARKAAEQITAEQLKDYLYFIASDEMEGRDTPSRGLNTVAKFIALNLKRWGFKPAGDDGTFFQKIALKSEGVDAEKTGLEIGGQKFSLNNDFFRLAGSGMANAPMVYGKDGWMIKAKNIDAFSGVDVKGKIVVLSGSGFPRGVLNPIPAGVTRSELKPEGRGTEWADPLTYAKQKGAVGIILIGSNVVQTNWEQVKSFLSRGNMYPEKLAEGDASNEQILPVLLTSSKIGEAIFKDEAKNPTSNNSAFELAKSANLTVTAKNEMALTQNVVAIWEGSDPVLKNEMVAIGAHYDHVGTNPNASGEDKIWNGADDDGSGTTGVLGIAEALAKSKIRPKRSILFVWHCGEEKGLWGSEYFNKFPTVDIKKVTAQLNIDMIGRSKKPGNTEPKDKELSGENEIYVIGSNMMSSTLGKIVADTNNNYLKMTYDFRYDDPKDPNRFFFRSDHFNYAVNGIPISFWFDGVHVDYHQPGDEPQKIDYQKMEKVSRTIFLTMWELANLKERPKVDKQLPPELTQR